MAALIPRAPARAVARVMINFRINPIVSFFGFFIRYELVRLVKSLPPSQEGGRADV